VRSIVTDVVGAASSRDLTDPEGRERVERRVLRAIKRQTDVHAEDVVFTDVAVQ
jgi:flagellar basal body-associated protein FliL